MTRILSTLLCSSLLISTTAFAAEGASNPNLLNPQPGQWSTMVAILDNSNNHYLLKTTVNDDVEACLAQLGAVSSKVKAAGDKVWTNPGKTALNFEKEANTEVAVKVLELRCVREPFEAELVKKFKRLSPN